MIKRYCDRCGMEIVPRFAQAICRVQQFPLPEPEEVAELCGDCYRALRRFLRIDMAGTANKEV